MNQSGSWSREYENQLARTIRERYQRVRECLFDIEGTEQILFTRTGRTEGTRAKALDRLERALRHAQRLDDPNARGVVLEAARAFREARRFEWELALSAERVARGEARGRARSTLSEDDLYGEGIVGLYEAARRFDPDRGIAFARYARWWVRAFMTNAIRRQELDLSDSQSRRNDARNVERFRGIASALGQDVSSACVAEALGISQDRVERSAHPRLLESLDARVPDGTSLRHERVGNPDARSVDDAVASGRDLQRMFQLADVVLDDRERLVLFRYYGVCGYAQTHEQKTAAELGMSVDRVKRIRHRAFRVLVAAAVAPTKQND